MRDLKELEGFLKKHVDKANDYDDNFSISDKAMIIAATTLPIIAVELATIGNALEKIAKEGK